MFASSGSRFWSSGYAPMRGLANCPGRCEHGDEPFRLQRNLPGRTPAKDAGLYIHRPEKRTFGESFAGSPSTEGYEDRREDFKGMPGRASPAPLVWAPRSRPLRASYLKGVRPCPHESRRRSLRRESDAARTRIRLFSPEIRCRTLAPTTGGQRTRRNGAATRLFVYGVRGEFGSRVAAETRRPLVRLVSGVAAGS